MAVDLNDDAVNDALDRIYDNLWPAGSIAELRTGPPAGANNPAGGTLLGSVTSPASPWNPAASGFKTKNGTWSGVSVTGGVIGHYRFRNAASTRIEEGTVGATGSTTTDATVNDLTVSGPGITININSFTKRLP